MPDQTDVFVPKGWGFEHIIVNTPKYCGKRLFVLAGRKCSWHYHKEKDETFYVLSGFIRIRREAPPEGFVGETSSTYGPGQIIRVHPCQRHQFEALQDTWLLEFSTHDDPADSIKLERGDVLPGESEDV